MIPSIIVKKTLLGLLMVISVVTSVFLILAVNRRLSVKPQPIAKPVLASDILRLVNEERAKVGVAPLVEDPRLDESAKQKADDMANNHYFGHENPTTKYHGYEYIRKTAPGSCAHSSENLLGNYTSAQAAMDGWMNSKAHREALLDARYDITGIAVAGGNIVQHFCDLK